MPAGTMAICTASCMAESRAVRLAAASPMYPVNRAMSVGLRIVSGPHLHRLSCRNICGSRAQRIGSSNRLHSYWHGELLAAPQEPLAVKFPIETILRCTHLARQVTHPLRNARNEQIHRHGRKNCRSVSTPQQGGNARPDTLEANDWNQRPQQRELSPFTGCDITNPVGGKLAREVPREPERRQHARAVPVVR